MKRQHRYWVLLTMRGDLAYPVLYPTRRQCAAVAHDDEQVVEITVGYGAFQIKRGPKPLYGDPRGVVASIIRLRR